MLGDLREGLAGDPAASARRPPPVRCGICRRAARIRFRAPPRYGGARAAVRLRPQSAPRLRVGSAPRKPGLARPRSETPAIRAASDLEALRHRDFEQMSAEEARAALELVRRAAHWWHRPTRRWQASARRDDLDLRRTLGASGTPAGLGALALARAAGSADTVGDGLRCLGLDAGVRSRISAARSCAGGPGPRGGIVCVCDATDAAHPLVARARPRSIARARREHRCKTGTAEPGSARRLTRAASRGSGRPRSLVRTASSSCSPTASNAARPRNCVPPPCASSAPAREVLWLNPLLRYPGYAPLARGAAALAETLRPVRPAHDPASLEALVRSLEALRGRRAPNRAVRAPNRLAGDVTARVP